MLELIRHHRSPLVLASLLAASVLLCAYHAGRPRGTSVIEQSFLTVLSPLHNGASWVGGGVWSVVDGYVWLVGVERENEALKQEVQRLRIEAQRLETLQQSNRRLEQLLRFAEGKSLALVGARVVARSPHTWFRSLLLDAGSRDAVAVGSAVLAPEGVVGQVTGVTAHSARVQLITDPSTGVAVGIGPQQVQGILTGRERMGLEVLYVPLRAAIGRGDWVFTSGLDELYPVGYLAGVVTAVGVTEDRAFQRVTVEPAVDFFELREVVVVVSAQRPATTAEGE